MTGVDKLHEAGYLGEGVRIAVIDSGVNYSLPALGGCFGPGCRVAKGDNLAADGEAGDPMDCVDHGTAVAAVAAGFSAKEDFLGVAPRATLHAYRVMDCDGSGTEDGLIAAWEKAYKGGANVITSSVSFPGSWGQSAVALVVARTVAQGVPCVVSAGNFQEAGLFETKDAARASRPSTRRAATRRATIASTTTRATASPWPWRRRIRTGGTDSGSTYTTSTATTSATVATR